MFLAISQAGFFCWCLGLSPCGTKLFGCYAHHPCIRRPEFFPNSFDEKPKIVFLVHQSPWGLPCRLSIMMWSTQGYWSISSPSSPAGCSSWRGSKPLVCCVFARVDSRLLGGLCPISRLSWSGPYLACSTSIYSQLNSCLQNTNNEKEWLTVNLKRINSNFSVPRLYRIFLA